MITLAKWLRAGLGDPHQAQRGDPSLICAVYWITAEPGPAITHVSVTA